MQNTIEIMKSLTFGTELEYTGIKREVAAKEIQCVIGGESGLPAEPTTPGKLPRRTAGSGKRCATVPWKTAAAKW